MICAEEEAFHRWTFVGKNQPLKMTVAGGPHLKITCEMSRRGISYDKLGNRQAAIADFTSAVLLDPSNLGAFFNRGTAYDALGRHDEATSDFARVLDVDIAADRPVSCIPLKLSDPSAVG